MSFSHWSGNVSECNGKLGKPAIVKGKWHFRSVGRGNVSFLIITEDFNFVSLNFKFALFYVLCLTV